MKVLVISNLYPPHVIGGYEIICKEIVGFLDDQHYEVNVLTSYYGYDGPCQKNNVYRMLENNWFKIDKSQKRHPRLNKLFSKIVSSKQSTIFKKFIKKNEPDIILVFKLDGLSLNLFKTVSDIKIPKIYYMADYWIIESKNDISETLQYWKDSDTDPFLKRVFKKVIYKLVTRKICINWNKLLNESFIFLSHDLLQKYHQKGFNAKNPFVVHHGMKLNNKEIKEERGNKEHIKLLYVGQIMEHKGVHTLLEAMKRIVCQYKYKNISLDLVGESNQSDYFDKQRHFVDKNNLKPYVVFHGMVKREALSKFYENADIFVFPSVWEEPFGQTQIEAMNYGLPIVGTATGGAKEILKDKINGLVFPPEDNTALSKSIKLLIDDEEFRMELSRNALRIVHEKFDVTKNLVRIKEVIEKAVCKGEL